MKVAQKPRGTARFRRAPLARRSGKYEGRKSGGVDAVHLRRIEHAGIGRLEQLLIFNPIGLCCEIGKGACIVPWHAAGQELRQDAGESGNSGRSRPGR
jgi:hypothetical protein